MKSIKQFIAESFDSNGDQINGFCILKPEFLQHEEDFFSLLNNNGWNVTNKVKRTLTRDEAAELYKKLKEEDFYNDLCDYMSSSDCISCMCYKDCEDPIKDMKSLKDKARKAWGIDDMKNAMHSSDSLDNVKREYKLIFEHK